MTPQLHVASGGQKAAESVHEGVRAKKAKGCGAGKGLFAGEFNFVSANRSMRSTIVADVPAQRDVGRLCSRTDPQKNGSDSVTKAIPHFRHVTSFRRKSYNSDRVYGLKRCLPTQITADTNPNIAGCEVNITSAVRRGTVFLKIDVFRGNRSHYVLARELTAEMESVVAVLRDTPKYVQRAGTSYNSFVDVENSTNVNAKPYRCVPTKI
ncbi:hypothetical protein EVAR_57924_1 [Eumeta japonica]|uniref:Uncharacterized protein n=1 Tax=Eumeta variegata TaxID=151549 RepID=A0A4C1ZJZ7_EUMVA|nr:hypothetical protein EVAR_57924_1 [Eumeta japonica]